MIILSPKSYPVQVSFGPLFDGALIDKTSLPSLVRATAINGFRALRSPLVSYRGRYAEHAYNEGERKERAEGNSGWKGQER